LKVHDTIILVNIKIITEGSTSLITKKHKKNYGKQSYCKPPLSGAKKHRQDKGTSCHHFDTTNVNFAYIKSEIMPFFCKNLNISQKFFTSIGLSSATS
jgi:hypothetical protein